MLVGLLFEAILHYTLMPIDYTKMFRIGHISISASVVAANCLSNVMLFFVRNITTLLLDRESMVILNSPTTTMLITRGEYEVLKNIDELWREKANDDFKAKMVNSVKSL